eukprot:scaffold2630_cov118-Isochrysis_galbana.AAC.8
MRTSRRRRGWSRTSWATRPGMRRRRRWPGIPGGGGGGGEKYVKGGGDGAAPVARNTWGGSMATCAPQPCGSGCEPREKSFYPFIHSA